MYINDIHNELMAYYNGTYATKDDKLYYIEDIFKPEPDGTDDYGDPRYSNDGEYEVLTSMHMFSTYAIEMRRTDVATTSGEGLDIQMDELDFSFPDMGLVNMPVGYELDGNSVSFNIVKSVTRRARRQWRRALRYDSLRADNVYHPIMNMIETITEQDHNEFNSRVSNNTLFALYFPEYVTVDHALNELECTIGTYALSDEWWVGQGKHGLVFGNHTNVCGSVSDDGKFSFEDSELEFLKESLIEVIGVDRYNAT